MRDWYKYVIGFVIGCIFIGISERCVNTRYLQYFEFEKDIPVRMSLVDRSKPLWTEVWSETFTLGAIRYPSDRPSAEAHRVGLRG